MAKNSKVLTAVQAKKLDTRAREAFGISTLVLMENAGRAVAEEAVRMLANKNEVAIFCGKGNNGGDGFVTARHLMAFGKNAEVFLCGCIPDVSHEAKANLEILLRLKKKIIEITQENLGRVKNKILQYDLIIDALLGIGLNKDVRGMYREVIGIINKSAKPVLSIDIPSGLDATTGKILGCAVKANRTVTFVLPKRGMFLGDGLKICGKIIVRDLGVSLQ